MAAVFQSGKGGVNWMVLFVLGCSDSLSTPSGNVHRSASPLYVAVSAPLRGFVVRTSTPKYRKKNR